MNIRNLIHTGAAAGLLALLAGHVPQAAAQAASIQYVNNGMPVATERSHTNTRIATEFYANDNRLLGRSICIPVATCVPRPPAGTARFAMVLEWDPQREELVSETCNGVASTVLQGQCINGNLRVTMRVRWGIVKWSFVPDPRPGKNIAAPSFGSFGPVTRLEFPNTDGTNFVGPKYWAPKSWPGSTAAPPPRDGMAVAAGDYDVATPDMSGMCKPVRTNPNERLNVREGQLTEFTVRYTGTMCTMSIQSYGTGATRVPDTAGTFASSPAGLQCNANPSASTCKAEFPFDSTVRLIANPQPGYTASFGRNFTGCSRNEPDQQVCEILADGNRELSSTFYVVTTTPPPPPPVALGAAAGPAAPADREANKGSTDVPMLQVLLTPSNGVARVNALTMQASGSGRDDLDLSEIRVYHDRNGDGNIDAGEPLLARGRAAADNGSLRLVLTTPLELSQPTALLVAADIASTVHTAAATGAAGAAGGAMLALGVLYLLPARLTQARAAMGRRRSWPAWRGLMATALVLLAACGGSGSGSVGDPAANDPPPVAPPVAPPVVPPVVPPIVPPPSVLLTYRLTLTAVEATDTAALPAALAVSPLPVTGALITVTQ